MSSSIAEVIETRAKVKRMGYIKGKYPIRFLVSLIPILVLGIIVTLLTKEQYVPYVGFSFFAIAVAILIGSLVWEEILDYRIKKTQKKAVGSLQALEHALPQMLNQAGGGPKGYVSLIVYRVLSKWLKKGYPDGNHPHLRDLIQELRIGLALLALHDLKDCEVGENGLIAGVIEHKNVREGKPGHCQVKWTLEEDGKFLILLNHEFKKGKFREARV